MKIAQVAPVFERVPPKAYGGTERVISYLTEELIRQGHQVTLFATGDSLTGARLISPIDQSRRFDLRRQEWLMYQTIMLDQVSAIAHEFDVIHFHTDYLHFPLARELAVPHVTTLHGRLDLPGLAALYRHFDAIPLVSISDSQRAPLPWANWQATIYHGLPPDLYSFQPDAGDYLIFIGRVSPEKRVDRAIDIALRSGMPLYIAAKVDQPDQAYFDDCIRPLLDHPLIRFIGEIGEQDKRHLLAGATALLFPIDWPEPFGLVMIESFACGTPVIAYPHGAVPEVMENGVSGFVVTDPDAAVAAVRHTGRLDRARCRRVFEQRFTAQQMASNYLQVYQQVRQQHAAAVRSNSKR